MRHLLVTNDFPPKLGGIQSYLWELWRRLPPDETTVLTTRYEGAEAWDREQGFRVVRHRDRVLLPHPGLIRQVDALAEEVGAEVVLLDPVLPLGMIGPHLRVPYGLVIHGAEITLPGRLFPTNLVMRRVLRGARFLVSAGGYPLAEAERAAGRPLRSVVVPPGVDTERFVPLDARQRSRVREKLGVADGDLVVVSVSRLVPRKGMDVLIEAAAQLVDRVPSIRLVIGGTGRDHARLERLARTGGVPVTFLGRVPDSELPGLYGAADVFAMLCRNRWAGLEQEGFGIVFLEAAAAGVPQVAGRSGGSHEAVQHPVTGLVVDNPTDVGQVVAALERLLTDPAQRAAMGRAARSRAESEYSYGYLADVLGDGLDRLAR